MKQEEEIYSDRIFTAVRCPECKGVRVIYNNHGVCSKDEWKKLIKKSRKMFFTEGDTYLKGHDTEHFNLCIQKE